MPFLHKALLLLVIQFQSVAANDNNLNELRVIVGTSTITNKLTEDRSSDGIYDQFLRFAGPIELVFAPYTRLEILMKNQEIDCLFPASLNTMPNAEQYISSLPLITSAAYFFSKDPYSSTDKFIGKNVAIRRGLTIGGIRQRVKANYIELDNDQALVNFVQLGRADAFVAYLTDVDQIYSSLNQTKHFYLRASPVYIAEESFVCFNTPENIRFMQLINRRISTFLQE